MIAIIALLMAILLPSLQRVRKQAKAVVCRSNLGQWGKALALYVEDSRGLLPGPSYGHGKSGTSGTWLLRGAFLSSDSRLASEDSFHHFHTKGIACCPMAVKPDEEGQRFVPFFVYLVTGGPVVLVEGTAGSTFRAWQITSPPPAFRGSYGFNEWLFNGRFLGEPEASAPDRGPGHRPRPGLDIFQLRDRATIPVLLDAGEPSGMPREDHSPPPLSKGVRLGSWMDTFCMNRHNGHVNGLFLDWSVRKIGLKELWTLKWHYEFNTAGRWTLAGGVQPEDWPKWMRGFKDY